MFTSDPDPRSPMPVEADFVEFGSSRQPTVDDFFFF